MFLASVIGFGISNLWPLAIGIILLRMIWKRPRIRINKWLWLMVLPVAISSFWSEAGGNGLIWSVCAVLCYIVGQRRFETNSRFWQVLPLFTITYLGVSIWQIFSGLDRPHGLASNASVLGMSGLTLFPYGASLVGISLSRTALLGSTILTFLTPNRYTIVALIIAVILSLSVSYHTMPDRLTIDGIEQATDDRIAAINGTSTEVLTTTEIVERHLRHLSWFGYGYDGYMRSTGSVQPHNIFIRSVWELGVLAIPFWIGAFMLWRQSRNWHVLVVVVICGMLVDEFYGSFQSPFMLLSLYTVTRGWPVWFGSRFHRLLTLPV